MEGSLKRNFPMIVTNELFFYRTSTFIPDQSHPEPLGGLFYVESQAKPYKILIFKVHSLVFTSDKPLCALLWRNCQGCPGGWRLCGGGHLPALDNSGATPTLLIGGEGALSCFYCEPFNSLFLRA